MPNENSVTGYNILHDPRLNKGTAFSEAERCARGLEGLLPPGVSTLTLQVTRVHTELANLDKDLQKYLLLFRPPGPQRDAILRDANVGPGRFHATGLHAYSWRGLPKVQSYFPRSARHVPADQCPRSPTQNPEQLATKGRTLHRRYRRGTHPRSR